MAAIGRVIRSASPHVLNPHASDFNPNKGQLWEGGSQGLESRKHLMPIALLVPALFARSQVPFATEDCYTSMDAADSYMVGEAVVAHSLQCQTNLNTKKGRVHGQTGDMVFVDFEDDRRALNVRNVCRAPPEEEDTDGDSDDEVEVCGPFPFGQGPPPEFFRPVQPVQPLPPFGDERVESNMLPGEEEDAPPPLIDDDDDESSDSDLCILRDTRGVISARSWGSPSDQSSQGISPEVSPRGSSLCAPAPSGNYVAPIAGNVVQGKVIRRG